MRLSDKQKISVLRSCEVTRPNATLRKIGGTWGAVWSCDIDKLICPITRVPSSQRWRCQLLTKVLPSDIWWSGEEWQAKTRKEAISMAETEASNYDW